MSTIAGSAFHKIVEVELLTAHGLDAGEVPEVEDAFEAALSKALHESRYTEADIRVSRTLPKGFSKVTYPNGCDKKFFLDTIPSWLSAFRNWLRSVPYDILLVQDDEFGGLYPAIELELNGKIGKNDVKAFVDLILVHRVTGAILIVDLKTGARKQTTPEQLGVYRELLRQQEGLVADEGIFYDARNGQATAIHDLREYTPERLGFEFDVAAGLIENNLLGPNYESCEYMCSVKDFCVFVGGKYASEVPAPWAPVDLGIPEVRA